MKGYSISYVIRELQTKTTIRYHSTPIRMTQTQNTLHQMLVRMYSHSNSHTLLMELQNGIATLEDSLLVSYKTKHIFTIGSSTHTPWYLSRWLKNLHAHKTCTWMCAAALFIISKTWKQPLCPSVGEWINEQWNLHIMEHYSGIKRNELSGQEKKWKKLKYISLSKRSQSERATYCMTSCMTLWKR